MYSPSHRNPPNAQQHAAAKTPQTHVAANYLKNKVMTATPEQLQMMLFDGALRFGEQGRVALAAKKYDESFDAMAKAQRIVLELRLSLKKDVSPDLCDKLGAIYTYVYKKLLEANMNRDSAALDEAMRLLRYQRETWAMLMEQLATQKAALAASSLDIPEPSARMEASISMQG